MSRMGQNRRLIGVSATDDLPSAADAPLQRTELAKSARSRRFVIMRDHAVRSLRFGS